MVIHITSGDIVGKNLAESGVDGEVFVWHDILYSGPRQPGWPSGEILRARASFLESETGGGLNWQYVLETLNRQYSRLKASSAHSVVLWFDACLFDQSMLCHILNCMHSIEMLNVELLCIDSFPGVIPYHGIGQLSPMQLSSVYDQRRPIIKEQFLFAEQVDRAFALQDEAAFRDLAKMTDAPLPWVPKAVERWVQERPDPVQGLGRLEQMALEAIRSGCEKPSDIYTYVSAKETPPQFWGDTTLWGKINGLADRNPPLVKIEGPQVRLPQWEGLGDLKLFRVFPLR